jgi:hypothetical protein
VNAGQAHLSIAPRMVETFKELLCIRLICIFPFLVLIASVALLAVVAFDEGFKPCPNFNSVSTKCSGTDRSGRPRICDELVEFGTFCGQSMHPRVTTCCRVPCLQNSTTYFDAAGKLADCLSQPFREMRVAIAGCVLLALSLAALLLVCNSCRVVPGFKDNIKFIAGGRRPFTEDSNRVDQELPEFKPQISPKAEV